MTSTWQSWTPSNRQPAHANASRPLGRDAFFVLAVFVLRSQEALKGGIQRALRRAADFSLPVAKLPKVCNAMAIQLSLKEDEKFHAERESTDHCETRLVY
jgi:hypothetical protein